MSRVTGGIFNFADRLGMAALDQRVQRANVISANVANAETPGYRALGYDFEEQLTELAHIGKKLSLNVSDSKHMLNSFTEADGKIKPDVFVKPTESVGEDGNTVDVDNEMVSMAQNQLLYRSSVELLNRKVGVLKYAINGGR